MDSNSVLQVVLVAVYTNVKVVFEYFERGKLIILLCSWSRNLHESTALKSLHRIIFPRLLILPAALPGYDYASLCFALGHSFPNLDVLIFSAALVSFFYRLVTPC